MHANKKNMVNAILILAGFTKCRQSSAGILPCDRAAAGGGRAVTLGCGDGGFILRNARRRNGNNPPTLGRSVRSSLGERFTSPLPLSAWGSDPAGRQIHEKTRLK